MQYELTVFHAPDHVRDDGISIVVYMPNLWKEVERMQWCVLLKFNNVSQCSGLDR